MVIIVGDACQRVDARSGINGDDGVVDKIVVVEMLNHQALVNIAKESVS